MCPDPEGQRQLARAFRTHFIVDEYNQLGGGYGEIYIRGAQSEDNRLLSSIRWRDIPWDVREKIIDQIRNGKSWWWPQTHRDARNV